MRKRSSGVTVLAIFLILTGGLRGLSAVYALMIAPRIMGERIKQFEALQAEGKVKTFSEEGMQKLEQAKRLLNEKRQLAVQPLFYGLLSVGALIAGIGILQLRGWARLLAMWQAGLSIPPILWGMYLELFRFNIPDASNMFSDPATQEMARKVTPVVYGWLAIIMLLSLCWNGFVIWFFRRPGVKAQFVKAATSDK